MKRSAQLGFALVMGFASAAIAAEPAKPTLHLFTDSQIPVDIRLNSGQLLSRYKVISNKAGATTTDQLENKLLLDVTVSFFKDGRVKLNFLGSTGKTFTGSFSPTDVGSTGVDQFRFSLRRFSLTLTPFAGMDVAFKDLEVSAGSMGAEVGAGTEDSYFDDDGYIMGYRAKVGVGKGGYLSVTGGYVGDFTKPSVFDRMDRMGDFNYLQALINHSIGAIAVASLDYTYWEKNDYVRGAIKFDLSKWTKFLDSLVLEELLRVNSSGSNEDIANVFAVKLSKKFKALLPGDRDLALTLAYIYNDKDMHFPIGDRSFVGHQMKVSVSCPNLATCKWGGKLGMFIQYLQNIEDWDQIRLELGMSLTF